MRGLLGRIFGAVRPLNDIAELDEHLRSDVGLVERSTICAARPPRESFEVAATRGPSIGISKPHPASVAAFASSLAIAGGHLA